MHSAMSRVSENKLLHIIFVRVLDDEQAELAGAVLVADYALGSVGGDSPIS